MTHRKRKEKISKPISPIAIIARKIEDVTNFVSCLI